MSFTKRSASAPPGFYGVEAAGLAWLAAAGPGSAPVVRVERVDAASITLERLQEVPPTRGAAAELGRGLAATHAAGASSFGQSPPGWAGDGYIGQQALTLRPESSWGVFYAEQRVLPYARRAWEVGHLAEAGLHDVERVCARLADGEFDDDRAPARIHGDLWAGNVLFSDRGAVLIDPAAHGGHRLTDLAMLHLFGAPQLPALTTAYVEAAGLAAGWEDLVGLHQLHPLLVHAVSHGASYGRQAATVARRYR